MNQRESVECHQKLVVLNENIEIRQETVVNKKQKIIKWWCIRRRADKFKRVVVEILKRRRCRNRSTENGWQEVLVSTKGKYKFRTIKTSR